MGSKAKAHPCRKCGSTEKASNGRGEFTCAPCRRARRRHSPTPKASAPKLGAPLTVAEFLLNKKRAECPVCRLKDPVRSLVLDAKKKGERLADIIEYLQAVHRIKIASADFASHVSQRHIQ